MFSIPARVLREVEPPLAEVESPEGFIAEYLGLRVGVRVPTPDDIAEVFFASLAGRVVPFDDFSFERWRTQRLGRPDDPRARFAIELTHTEFVTIEESPLNGATLAQLATRGTAWTVGGVQVAAGSPWVGLGIVILGEFGLIFASAARGFRERSTSRPDTTCAASSVCRPIGGRDGDVVPPSCGAARRGSPSSS